MWKIKASSIAASVIILLFTLFSYMSVYADDGSLGRTPDGVFPMQENDVIMESEEITVDLEKNSVECIFVFYNSGKSKNVLMGFPGRLDKSLGGELTEDINLELQLFKAFVKGQELPVTREKSVQPDNTGTSNVSIYSEWFTFTVPFKADERVTVRNTYDFRPTYISNGDVLTGYVLQTGALWKEPIGSAKVTFKLGKIQPYQIERLRPGGFKFIEDKLVWERNDFEPLYDLQVDYNTWLYSNEFLKETTSDEAAKIKQKIESYNKVKELEKKDGIDEMLAAYDLATEERYPVLGQYIKSFLPVSKIPDEIPDVRDISILNENDSYNISCDITGLYTASIKLRISHIESGKEIVDGEFDTSSCIIGLIPGTEYNISCTLRDWMDRTDQKAIKYKVPEQPSVSTSDPTQPSVLDEVPVPTVLVSQSRSLDEPVKNARSNDLNLVIWGVSGFILFELLVISATILHKKRL